MKRKILYYSDIDFFAGCENMIGNFLNSSVVNNEYDIKFIYRYSEKYKNGLYARVINNDSRLIPINLFKRLKFKYSNIYVVAIIQKIITLFPIIISKYFSIIFNTFTLIKYIKKYDPDIIHINNGGYPAASSCYSAVFAAKFLNVKKIIYVVNNMAEGYTHPFRWFDYILDFFVAKYVNVFITGSFNAGKRLKKVLKLPCNKQKTINNGVIRRQVSLEKSAFLKKYSIDFSGHKIASVIANLEDRKGHIYLLKAIKEIQDNNKFKDLILIIEGVGPLKKEIHKFINDNRLDNIVMIDRVDKIFNLINASDFLILPSIGFEDFPNIIIEAFSLGKPVIGSRIAGIPEQIDDHGNGILVKPKNISELVDAILFFDNESKIIEYGNNAIIKFDSRYDISIAVNNYMNLYKL